MVQKAIWLVFYTLAIAMLAALLYNVLLVYDYDKVNTEVPGYVSEDGSRYRLTVAGGIMDGKGALWVAADTIQNACSSYFYNYAYLPMIHQNDEIDQQLCVQSDYFMMEADGTAIEDDVTSAGGYKNTPTDLSNTNVYEVDSEGSGEWYHEDNYRP